MHPNSLSSSAHLERTPPTAIPTPASTNQTVGDRPGPGIHLRPTRLLRLVWLAPDLMKDGGGRGRGGEEDSAGPSAAMSLALRSPRSPSLNPLAPPYERVTRGAVRGTPDWLRYSASSLSSLDGSQSRSPSAAHRKGKGKAVAMDISPIAHRSVPPSGGFMADARRRGPASSTSAGRPRPRMPLEREASDVARALGRELQIPNISDEGPSGEG